MRIVIVAALSALALATPVHAQIHVDIGVHFPAPPPLVVVPEMPRVQYVPPPVPAEPANLFFYNGQYWAYANGGWYAGPGYNGPWIVVAPQFVPRPIYLARTNAVLPCPAWTLAPVGSPPTTALA